jgi:hypothetical protein
MSHITLIKQNSLVGSALDGSMKPIVRLLLTVVIAHAFIAGNAFAQSIKNPPVTNFDLSSYVAQRWLYGNPDEMLKELQYLNYQIPINGMQISTKRLLTKERNAAVVADFVEYARAVGKVQPPSQIEAKKQFEQWRDCLVKEYEARFTPDNLKKLLGYWNAGVFRDFPQLTVGVKEITFVSMQRLAGMRAQRPPPINADQTYKESYLQDSLPRLYFALANPIQDTYMAMFLPNGKNYGDLQEELKITLREQLAAGKPLGLDAKAWSNIETYAMSDLPANEQSIFRACHNGSFTKPMSSWSTGVYSVMTEYFDKKYASFGN